MGMEWGSLGRRHDTELLTKSGACVLTEVPHDYSVVHAWSRQSSMLNSADEMREALVDLYWEPPPTSGHGVIFRDVSYSVGNHSKRKIVHSVSGICPARKLTAIMGSSGSGKTTLLDVLAMRTTRGDAVGQLLHPCPPEDFGYVLQDDVLLGTLTVEEMLTFGVMLRRKQSADAAKRDVESVMRMLRLTKIRSQRIGTLRTRGISGGERRRVSIGLELALKPKVLFIDEVTHPDSTPST